MSLKSIIAFTFFALLLREWPSSAEKSIPLFYCFLFLGNGDYFFTFLGLKFALDFLFLLLSKTSEFICDYLIYPNIVPLITKKETILSQSIY